MSQKKQKRNSAKEKETSSGNTTTGSPQSALAASKPLREFIYLDYPKLTSYYAQLFDGWRSSTQYTRTGEEQTINKGPDTTTDFEFDAGAGTTDDEANFARLLGIMADINIKLGRQVNSHGLEVGRTQAESVIENTELHHAIFQRVEHHLKERGLIETIPGRKASSLPFYSFTGTMQLMVFDDYIRFVNEHNELRSAMTGLGHEGISEIDNADHLHYVLNRFYKGQIGVIVTQDRSSISATLNPDHMLVDAGHITATYGRQTTVPFTLLGLKAGNASAKAFSRPQGTNTSALMEAMVRINDGLHKMDQTYQVRDEVHLFPIALYVEMLMPDEPPVVDQDDTEND